MLGQVSQEKNKIFLLGLAYTCPGMYNTFGFIEKGTGYGRQKR
jgi:hypothetical protein